MAKAAATQSSSSLKKATKKKGSSNTTNKSSSQDCVVGMPGVDMTSRIIYIGRLPKEFSEPQLLGYFSQFGRVLRMRLARNKRTLATKHYAFLEFESAAVARIVCNAMNNYLLDGKHLLQCRIVDCRQFIMQKKEEGQETNNGVFGVNSKAKRDGDPLDVLFKGKRYISTREAVRRAHTDWMAPSLNNKTSLEGKVQEINEKAAQRRATKQVKLAQSMPDFDMSAVPVAKVSIQPLCDIVRRELAQRKSPKTAKEDWEEEWAEELAALDKNSDTEGAATASTASPSS